MNKIIIGIVILHFVVGIGLLIYKISTAKGTTNNDSETKKTD